MTISNSGRGQCGCSRDRRNSSLPDRFGVPGVGADNSPRENRARLFLGARVSDFPRHSKLSRCFSFRAARAAVGHSESITMSQQRLRLYQAPAVLQERAGIAV